MDDAEQLNCLPYGNLIHRNPLRAVLLQMQINLILHALLLDDRLYVGLVISKPNQISVLRSPV